MFLSLAASSITASIALVLGLPLALARPSSRSSLATLAIDSLLIGTAALVSLISLYTWTGWSGTLALGAALATVAVIGSEQAGPLQLPQLRPRPTWFAGLVAALLVIGTLLRLRTVEFIQWTGDMGNYVNAANRFVETGEFQLGFPPGFAAYLAVPARLLGIDATTASVPLLGVLLLGTVVRLMTELRLDPIARLVGLSIAVFSFVAIWYSSFPVSETLQAPLTILLITVIGGALVRSDRTSLPVGDLGVVALVALALGLTRGTGPLLVLPLVALLGACLHPAWRRHGLVTARLVVAATLGLGVSYVYGIDRIGGYFVDLQIGNLLPEPAFDVLNRLGLLRLSPQLLTAWVALMVLIAFAGLGMERWASSAADHEQRRTTWPLALTAPLAVAVVAVLALEGSGEILNQFGRMGMVLLVLGLVALVLPRAVEGERGPTVLTAALVVVLMLAVQIPRFDNALAHAYFLYWDRYLFSEILPVLVVLTALTVDVALEWAARSERVWVPITARAGAAVLVAAFVASQFQGVRLTQQRTSFEGTNEFYDELIALIPDESLPLIWTGPGSGADGWPVFPNSWHSFGRPLEVTYGRTVMNFPRDGGPFAQDPVVGERDVAELLACTVDGRAYVVEFSRQDDADLDRRLAASELDVQPVGSVDADVPLLRHLDTKAWETMPMSADVWTVEAPRSSLPDCTR